MEPDLKQNSFVSEQQFNHFIGQSSLAEYFQNFISRETIELGDVKCSREKFTDGPNTGYCTYPRFSSLSIEDHKMILEEYKNVVKGIDVEPGQMVAQGLKSQVLSEQQEFQHFVFLKARDNVEHYNYIHPEARQLLQMQVC